MKKISALSQFCFAAALFWAALPCLAQSPPRVPKQQENRFLFIVDTSAAMRSYSGAVVQNVADLLESDMRGEFRQGDTIGLWLYNDKLDPQYPMQIWSKANKDAIATEMTAFLRARLYEKQERLDKVMPVLNQLIKTSQRITVILIFDGSGSIHGTPYDKEIHALQKKYAHELRSAHMPFVLILAARDGAVFDYTINYPGLVAIPHTANPEPPIETNAPVAAVVVPPVTNVPAKSREPNPIFIPRPAIVVPATASAPAHVELPIVQSPKVVLVPPPPAAPVATSPNVVIVPAPQPVAPVAPAPVSQPTIVAATPPAAPVTPAPASQPAIVPAAPPQAQPAPPPAPAVATVKPAGGTQLAMFIAAFSLLTIAVVLVVFLFRRSRGPPESSLISQSIDRPR